MDPDDTEFNSNDFLDVPDDLCSQLNLPDLQNENLEELLSVPPLDTDLQCDVPDLDTQPSKPCEVDNDSMCNALDFEIVYEDPEDWVFDFVSADLKDWHDIKYEDLDLLDYLFGLLDSNECKEISDSGKTTDESEEEATTKRVTAQIHAWSKGKRGPPEDYNQEESEEEATTMRVTAQVHAWSKGKRGPPEDYNQEESEEEATTIRVTAQVHASSKGKRGPPEDYNQEESEERAGPVQAPEPTPDPERIRSMWLAVQHDHTYHMVKKPEQPPKAHNGIPAADEIIILSDEEEEDRRPEALAAPVERAIERPGPSKPNPRKVNMAPVNKRRRRKNSDGEPELRNKRELHNDMERKRRGDLSNLVEVLRKMVPGVKNNPRASKVDILKTAAKYCKELARGAELIKRKLQLLKRRHGL